MDVLLTGASGRVGTAILEHLGDRDAYTFHCLDRDPHPDYPTHVADITDRDALDPIMAGQDAVIHLAGDPSPSAHWPGVFEDNILGTHHVVQAAMDAAVDRIMFASTNHVVGGYWEAAAAAGPSAIQSLAVDHRDPPRPDSYYAISKLFGEHLGRYAVEFEPAPTRFYAIRIGWVLPPAYDHPWGGPERAVDLGRLERGTPTYERRARFCRSLWCARRDMATLTDCVLQDEHVSFDVFYATSRTDPQWLDLDHARDVLEYVPTADVREYEPPGD